MEANRTQKHHTRGIHTFPRPPSRRPRRRSPPLSPSPPRGLLLFSHLVVVGHLPVEEEEGSPHPRLPFVRCLLLAKNHRPPSRLPERFLCGKCVRARGCVRPKNKNKITRPRTVGRKFVSLFGHIFRHASHARLLQAHPRGGEPPSGEVIEQERRNQRDSLSAS